MSRLLARGLLVFGILTGVFEGMAALTLLHRAPLRLHDWWLLPAACTNVHCVTYRQWSAAVRRADVSARDAPEILTRLLTSRAAVLIARRSGLAVSDGEVDAALRVLRTTTASEPAIEAFLATRAVDLGSGEFRLGMRELLLQEKLAAAGVTDVWKHPAAPSVTVFHARYRWDERAHQVELRGE
ncbi:MAG: hypothetical protein G01um101438_92 [Parcubacteria group bacterium Gr01-1014_38]|nr:MAG: hypothetical protein G01um101438_92 [Parcubacteria group bacterium Gr01-1014_38]